MEALRARFADMLGALGEHKLEVLNEAGGKRIVLLEILVAVGPGTGRIEDQRGDVAEAVHVYKGLGECYNSRGRVGCDVLPKRISLAGEGKAGFMV